MNSESKASSLDAIVEEAAAAEPVQEEARAFAERLGERGVQEALERAFELREPDAATMLALAHLPLGLSASADAVEAVYPDSISDVASQALVAAHPDALDILERLMGSRRLDRFQLASAALLYTELAPEGPWPGRLLEILRTLARAREGWVGEDIARYTAWQLDDPATDELYAFDRDGAAPPAPPELEAHEGDPGLGWLPEARSNVIASGFTARRAAKKVGRNEPCPCGSGTKYKKCCAKKDETKSRSPVAGLTMREYRRRLHEFLSAEELHKQHPADLVRLPLEELATDQLDAVYSVFLDCERMDDAERALELLATRELEGDVTLDMLRAELVAFAHDWGYAELVARQLDRIEDASQIPEHVLLGRQLRSPAAGENPLAALEERCLPHVTAGEDPPMQAAYELIEPFPALGLMLARACLDARHPTESETMLAEIEWARDRLGAPPEDPYRRVWERMVDDDRVARASDEEKESLRAELERLRAEAEDARASAFVLQRELGKHEASLEELEAKAAQAEARAEATEGGEAQAREEAEAARRLRLKIRELEGRIREGQRERADLRRHAEELASAEESPESRPETPADEPPSVEEEEPVSAKRAVRVPVWSDKARSSLAKLSHKIASSAVAAAGALGAGRPEAWRHAKRLEGMHGLRSARLGIHHRLLFRVDDDGVLDVDEIVTREDLDRALAARR